MLSLGTPLVPGKVTERVQEVETPNDTGPVPGRLQTRVGYGPRPGQTLVVVGPVRPPVAVVLNAPGGTVPPEEGVGPARVPLAVVQTRSSTQWVKTGTTCGS